MVHPKTPENHHSRQTPPKKRKTQFQNQHTSACADLSTAPRARRCTAGHRPAEMHQRCPAWTARLRRPPTWSAGGSHGTGEKHSQTVTFCAPWWSASSRASSWSCSPDADSSGSCGGWGGSACCSPAGKPVSHMQNMQLPSQLCPTTCSSHFSQKPFAPWEGPSCYPYNVNNSSLQQLLACVIPSSERHHRQGEQSISSHINILRINLFRLFYEFDRFAPEIGTKQSLYNRIQHQKTGRIWSHTKSIDTVENAQLKDTDKLWESKRLILYRSMSRANSHSTTPRPNHRMRQWSINNPQISHGIILEFSNWTSTESSWPYRPSAIVET